MWYNRSDACCRTIITWCKLLPTSVSLGWQIILYFNWYFYVGISVKFWIYYFLWIKVSCLTPYMCRCCWLFLLRWNISSLLFDIAHMHVKYGIDMLSTRLLAFVELATHEICIFQQTPRKEPKIMVVTWYLLACFEIASSTNDNFYQTLSKQSASVCRFALSMP